MTDERPARRSVPTWLRVLQLVALVGVTGLCYAAYGAVKAWTQPAAAADPIGAVAGAQVALASSTPSASPTPTTTPLPTATPDPRLAQLQAELAVAQTDLEHARIDAEIAAYELQAARDRAAIDERQAGATATAQALGAIAGAQAGALQDDRNHQLAMLDITRQVAQATAQAANIAAERELAAWQAEQTAANWQRAVWIIGALTAVVLVLFGGRWLITAVNRHKAAQGDEIPESGDNYREIPINDYRDQRAMARATEYIERWLDAGGSLDEINQSEVEQLAFGYTGGDAYRKVKALLDGMKEGGL